MINGYAFCRPLKLGGMKSKKNNKNAEAEKHIE
jgi:hypothetical protein